ncbi:MAG: hypothetical protein KAJ63_01665 [Methyloprofundus sp.]|nr:hypothetical protein [Methyloprofundus sp.]
MSRHFSGYTSDIGKSNLDKLADSSTNVDDYSNALYLLGKELGHVVTEQITDENKNICVACTVEDADFLAKGMIDSLSVLYSDISLACFWNQRQQALSIAPIIKKYCEPAVNNANVLVIVKSIISGACVVKTNLTNLIQDSEPDSIFVVAPVMHVDAQKKLDSEFPSIVANKFKYIYFAIDDEMQANGNLVPGIGGNVYQRLGFKDQDDKNKFIPKLVKERRESFISA